MTLTVTFDFDLEQFTKANIFETSVKANLLKYAWILCPGHNLLSRSYGSSLPISLTYINLSTRGFEPRRPDAEMGMVCVETGPPEEADVGGRARAATGQGTPRGGAVRSPRNAFTPTPSSVPESDPCV